MVKESGVLEVAGVVITARRHSTKLLVAFDAGAWLAAALAAGALRYPGLAGIPWLALVLVGLGGAVVYTCVGALVRLHEGRARTASLEEMLLLSPAALLAGFVIFAANLVSPEVARSVPLIAAFCFILIAACGRATWRRLVERSLEISNPHGATRVLLVGAGEAARELINSMLRDPEHSWRPIGMLDDDRRKRHLRIRGVPVLGETSELETTLRETGVQTVILAIPSADSEFVRQLRQLRRRASEAGVDLKVLPAATELLTGRVGIRDIRDINLTDVLGRNQLDTDIHAIAGYLTGKRVLVTGAGGSIGSELCRQINRFAPRELIMLDRDESALHAVQLSLHGRALLDTDDVVLCDIRDLASLKRIFLQRRPEVVFHAAALMRLPILEQYPTEAVKTNIIGTRNVLDASVAVNVTRFVNISTDKAANPVSVLGYSKRVAERLSAAHADTHDGSCYLSVPFDNVLGSRGSVLSAFAEQIAHGGPATVTHREVTRYFMTIEEACQLVVQAGAIGEPGEALVLDMGNAVRIVDVAHQLIEMSGRRVDIEFTGLRDGEKMHEDLFGAGEPRDVRPDHPLISHVSVPPVSEDQVGSIPTSGPPTEVTRALSEMCGQERIHGAAGGGMTSRRSAAKRA